MFKAIAIGLMASPLALGGASANRLQPSIKRAVYNDNQYSITLSADELNDVEFTNLQSYLDGLTDLEAGNLSNTTVTYNNSTESSIAVGNDGGNLYIIYASGSICFGYEETNLPNYWTLTENGQRVDFEGDLVWNVTSTYYDDVKTALQLDIPEESMPSIADIFNEVTSAITAFVGSLGTAFTNVTSLFYASGEWTFLGVLVLIGVGVGILYGAYRIIKGLLHRV